MLLFSAWKCEDDDLPIDEIACLEKYVEKKDEIEANRQVIYPGEPTIEMLDADDLEMIRPQHLLETLDGQGNQENADDLNEGIIDDPEFESFGYTGNLNMEGRQQFEDFKYQKICLPSDNDLAQMTRQLVPEQMNIMRKVISSCKDIVKSQKYPQLKRNPVRLIVHGGAGVGKSQTIRVVSMQAENN